MRQALPPDYPDLEVLDLLCYGFPLNFCGPPIPPREVENYSGATMYPTHIEKFLARDLALGRIFGPFPSPPFADAVINPLNTVPKKDSLDRRVILNLSHPKEGPSVNSGTPKDTYLGEDWRLRYVRVDDLVEIVLALGRGCVIYKRDWLNAYRNLSLDPGCVHLVGWIRLLRRRRVDGGPYGGFGMPADPKRCVCDRPEGRATPRWLSG